MQREGGGELGSGSSGGAGTAPPADSAKPASVQRLTLLATLRYGSANLLLVLGAAALVIGGWAIWGILAFALVFGSFADEVNGDDDMSLKESRCLFCTVNLYLTLPLVALLAFLLVRFAALRPSLTEQPFETIGALWLTGYLFALAGPTVAHELTHRNNRLAKLSAYFLLGFTGNASFVIYHIYTHHRQVGTYQDAATARRGERLRTFMARTLTQQFAQAARFEVARLRRKGLSPYSWQMNSSWRISCRWRSWLSQGSSAAGRACWSSSSPA
jgi:alkane 1-monooxygenase